MDAAARLFVEQGFGATSTREIAEAVGIRQASLYYYFDNKQEILGEIIAQSIRPTLERTVQVERLAGDPASALYLLALLDVRTLADAPHNAGVLGRLPEVSKHVPEFGAARVELSRTYGRLGALVSAPAVDSRFLGWQILQHVESVISWRADGIFDTSAPDVLATAIFRICGVPDERTVQAGAAAHELLERLDSEPDD